MPRTPFPLPPSVAGGGPFPTQEANALGVSRGRLRATDLDRPTWGVRRTRAVPSGPQRDRPLGPDPRLLEQARAYAVGLPPDAAFCSVTAARLHALPLPWTWESSEPLDVIRMTDLAGRLALPDLVAVGDALLLPRGLLAPADFAEAVTRRPGARGIRKARHAARLLRPGAASPWESKARVVFHEEGLPEPELNVDIISSDGDWLARGDFVWRRAKVVGEFDGDHHRTDRRLWQYERERRAGLEDDGWRYIEFTSLTLTVARHREALIARLRQWLGTAQ